MRDRLQHKKHRPSFHVFYCTFSRLVAPLPFKTVETSRRVRCWGLQQRICILDWATNSSFSKSTNLLSNGLSWSYLFIYLLMWSIWQTFLKCPGYVSFYCKVFYRLIWWHVINIEGSSSGRNFWADIWNQTLKKKGTNYNCLTNRFRKVRIWFPICSYELVTHPSK